MTALADRERAVAYLDARISRGDGADDCWTWTLKPDRDGYGVASFGGRQWRAHRLSYTVHVGDIPDGHDLDHVCETRLCVRPSHLPGERIAVGTDQEDHCDRSHPVRRPAP